MERVPKVKGKYRENCYNYSNEDYIQFHSKSVNGYIIDNVLNLTLKQSSLQRLRTVIKKIQKILDISKIFWTRQALKAVTKYYLYSIRGHFHA